MGTRRTPHILVGVLVVLHWSVPPAGAGAVADDVNTITTIMVNPPTYPDIDSSTINFPVTINAFYCIILKTDASASNNERVGMYMTNVWTGASKRWECTKRPSAPGIDTISFACSNVVIYSVGTYERQCVGNIAASTDPDVSSTIHTFSVYNLPTLFFVLCPEFQYGLEPVSCTCTIDNDMHDDQVMTLAMGESGGEMVGGLRTPAKRDYTYNDTNPMTLVCEARVNASDFLVNQISTQIKFIYGPMSVTVEPVIFTPPVRFEYRSIAVKCLVPVESFYPSFTTEMTMLFPVGGNDPVYSYNTTYGGFVEVHYSHTFHLPGLQVIKCTATNTMREAMAVSATGQFEVYLDNIVEIQDCPLLNGEGKSVPTITGVDDVIQCTCNLTVKGFPVGQPVWLDDQGNSLSTDPNAAILVLFSNGTNGLKYTCAAGLTLQETFVNMTATLIYGPGDDAVSITPDQANAPQDGFRFLCQVDSSRIEPDYTMTFDVAELSDIFIPDLVNLDDHFYNVVVPTPGNYTARCTVTNLASNRIVTEAMNFVNVEPDICADLAAATITDCGGYDPVSGGDKWIAQGGDKEPFTCSCNLTTPGDPLLNPYVQWLDAATGLVMAEDTTMAVLNYTSTPGETAKTFTCQAVGDFGTLNSKDLDLKYAFGPVDEDIEIILQAELSESNTFHFACVTNTTAISPDAVFAFEVVDVGDTFEMATVTYEGPIATSTHSVSGISTPGSYWAKCQVVNSQSVASNSAAALYEFSVRANPIVELINCPVDVDGTSQTTFGAKTASCTCKMTYAGYPPARQVDWFDSSGDVVASDPAEAILHVNAGEDENKEYSCLAVSDRVSDTLIYTPSFVYGPDEVIISQEYPTNTDDDDDVLWFSCSVNASDLYPNFITLFSVLEPTSETFEANHTIMDPDTGVFSSHYNVTSPTTPGNYTAVCQSSNTGAGDSIIAESTLVFTIQGPPSAEITNCSVYEAALMNSTSPPYRQWVDTDGPQHPIQCLCQLTDVGFPPDALAQWVDGQTGQTIVEGRPVAVLNYNNLSGEKSKSFKCQAQNSGSISENSTSFEVDFIYGPLSANILISLPDNGDDPSHIHAECFVHPNISLSATVTMKATGVGVIREAKHSEPDEVLPNSLLVFRADFAPPLDSNGKPELENMTVGCTARNDVDETKVVEGSVELEMPSVVLQDCPVNLVSSEYSVEKCQRVANCTCSLDERGIPSGQARWVEADGPSRGQVSDDGYSSLLSVNASDHGKLFACQAVTLTSAVHQVHFYPVFSIPPDDSPMIEIISGDDVTQVVNGTAYEFDLGEVVDIRCIVEGGVPRVSSYTLTYGTENVTALNVSGVSTQLTISRDHSQIEVTCFTEHPSGCYSDSTTTFSIDVLLPAAISDYQINGQVSQTVEVNRGELVTFYCVAEGFPAPQMAVAGLLTSVTLAGQRVAMEANFYRFTTTIPSAVVLDTDTYSCTALNPVPAAARRRKKRCASDVAQTDEKKSSNLIVLGPPAPAYAEDSPPEAMSRPDGRVLAKVEVVSHPAPSSYSLAKAVGQEDVVQFLDVDVGSYAVTLEPVDCRTTMVVLTAMDFRKEENTRYKFTINNGEGDHIDVFMGSRMVSDPESRAYRDTDDEDYNAVVGLSILGGLLLVVVVLSMVWYCYWIREGKGKLENKKKTGKNGGQRMHPHPRMHQHPRLWWSQA